MLENLEMKNNRTNGMEKPCHGLIQLFTDDKKRNINSRNWIQHISEQWIKSTSL